MCTPSSRFNESVSFASVDLEIECGNLFVLVTFLFGLAVGGAFTYCYCVLRDNPRKLRRTVILRDEYEAGCRGLKFSRSPFVHGKFCPLWIQQRFQSSRGCWWCKAMPYLLGLSWVIRAESGMGMHAAWNIGASRSDISTFPRSSRLSVHDRRRDRKWIRPDEVTAREQHHPGVTHPADGIWLLARLQRLPPECGPSPAPVRGKGDWWRVLEMAQVCRKNQSHSCDDWSTTRDQAALSKCSEARDEMARTP